VLLLIEPLLCNQDVTRRQNGERRSRSTDRRERVGFMYPGGSDRYGDESTVGERETERDGFQSAKNRSRND
jgi:hypothetical protein